MMYVFLFVCLRLFFPQSLMEMFQKKMREERVNCRRWQGPVDGLPGRGTGLSAEKGHLNWNS